MSESRRKLQTLRSTVDEFVYRGTHGTCACAHNHEGHEDSTKAAKGDQTDRRPGCELTLKAEPAPPTMTGLMISDTLFKKECSDGGI
ncbi:MAG: hypothetical protein AB9866_26975 [Syntrophobacteraceae bacterium]